VPPIGIEGMMDVIQYHGLKIIPIDIADYESKPKIDVDINKVKSKLSEKTVAVLVVHPFGLICMDDNEMKSLRRVIDDHDSEMKIEIWEDCAECYGGRKGYAGSKYANVHFFSFGMIKTATALGGGICVINECVEDSPKLLGDTMKRIQHTMHGQQTRQEYLVKILKAFLLQFFSQCPTVLGIFLYLLGLFHINYDQVVTSSVKGFPTKCDNVAL
jgi:Predicted pyridoxal phosphate-dependent enzyme apparently involved in regulation of cell wall biogenesis